MKIAALFSSRAARLAILTLLLGSSLGLLPHRVSAACPPAILTYYYGEPQHINVVGASGYDCVCHVINWGVRTPYFVSQRVC